MAVRQKIVVLTGAGISRESGIPTFRDNNGMWKKYDAQKLASVAGFEEDPQAVLDFYNAQGRISWRCSLIMPTGCWQSWRNYMM